MLITTSRYCPKETRELSKAFAIVFSGAYVARGKKTIDELVEFARKKGHSRICVLMSGNFGVIPNKSETISMEFISVNELGRWSWIDSVICIIKHSFSSSGLCACSAIEGGDSKLLSELLDFEENEKAEGNAFAGNGKISFSNDSANGALAGGAFLDLEVKYESRVQDTH